MLEKLTDTEKEVMLLLIQGHNFNAISDLLCIDYNLYVSTKKSLFKKLHISRVIQILPLLLSSGYETYIWLKNRIIRVQKCIEQKVHIT